MTTTEPGRLRALDADGVDAFVHRLRGTFAEIYPANWQIDWRNVPSPFRWYEGVPRLDLPPVPRRLLTGGPAEAAELAGRGCLALAGGLLHAAYGLTGVRWYPEGIAKSSPEEPAPVHRDPHYQLRRAVPSGGVTYPAECYLSTGGDGTLPAGVYHYDATRHALAPLAAGRPPAGVGRADGGLRLVLTVPLWKNHFKYGDFSYRLAAMDTGTVLGQFALTAKRWGWSCRISFGNDEARLLDQLGLDEAVEAAPVVLDIGPSGRLPDTGTARVGPLSWIGSTGRLDEAAGARRMHGACLRSARPGVPIDLPPVTFGDVAACPDAVLPVAGDEPPSVADAWSRTALGEQFRGEPVGAGHLARWLAQVTAPLDCDVPGAGTGLAHPRCVLLAKSVTGVPAGAYLPLPGGGLGRLAEGEFGELVQSCLFGSYMNFTQAPLIAVLAGSAEPQRGASGAVGYRTQHALAGVLAQRLAVAAARDGYSAHPVLGFVPAELDRGLGLTGRGLTSLLLVGVGRYRRALFLENSLHPVAGAKGSTT
jgi:SagB-type dehydrogenase family enzyme